MNHKETLFSNSNTPECAQNMVKSWLVVFQPVLGRRVLWPESNEVLVHIWQRWGQQLKSERRRLSLNWCTDPDDTCLHLGHCDHDFFIIASINIVGISISISISISIISITFCISISIILVGFILHDPSSPLSGLDLFYWILICLDFYFVRYLSSALSGSHSAWALPATTRLHSNSSLIKRTQKLKNYVSHNPLVC